MRKGAYVMWSLLAVITLLAVGYGFGWFKGKEAGYDEAFDRISDLVEKEARAIIKQVMQELRAKK